MLLCGVILIPSTCVALTLLIIMLRFSSTSFPFSSTSYCQRSLRILDRGGSDSLSLKHSHDPLTKSSTQASLSELVSAPGIIIEGQTLAGFPSSEAAPSPGINPNDVRFRRSISYNEVDTPEASFIDIIKSSKKPIAESEAHPGTPHDLMESGGGHGGKAAKKKGKKGRQIDPALLGFKVHSNRIMMGEIQRPDD